MLDLDLELLPIEVLGVGVAAAHVVGLDGQALRFDPRRWGQYGLVCHTLAYDFFALVQ